MSDALTHRGPDAAGLLSRPRIGLASRRLSIVGLADGDQPVANEDGSVHAVFNGELFDYPDIKDRLQARSSSSHILRHGADPASLEDLREQMFAELRGQFAIALWSERRQLLLLARDRFGIVPLYWPRQRRIGARRASRPPIGGAEGPLN